MSDKEHTIEEAMKWSEDKLGEEEEKVAAIEPIKYKAPGVNFVVGGKEKPQSKEQAKRMQAIMRPLDNIHFSWTSEQMKNIVTTGLEARKEFLSKLDAGLVKSGSQITFKQNSEDINKLKEELSKLAKEALTLGQELSDRPHDKTTKEKKLKKINASIKEIQGKFQECIDKDLDLVRAIFQSELTERHEDEELDESIPMMLATRNMQDVHEEQNDRKEVDISGLITADKSRPTDVKKAIQDLQNFFDESKSEAVDSKNIVADAEARIKGSDKDK